MGALLETSASSGSDPSTSNQLDTQISDKEIYGDFSVCSAQAFSQDATHVFLLRLVHDLHMLMLQLHEILGVYWLETRRLLEDLLYLGAEVQKCT